MSLLFETIKIKDGKVQNPGYHNDRFNRSRRDLFGIEQITCLEEIIKIPSEHSTAICKCKVVYNSSIKGVNFSHYVMKSINRLIMVKCDEIDYSYKYSDRSLLDELLRNANCSYDEEILIIKNGCLSDTSYSNIALFDGSDWITPSTPLLAGTKRAKLLDNGIIREDEIRVTDLKYFESIKLFNAMIDFDESPKLPIDSIV
jgi:4-amino-4-deoxychorismate lyase